MTIYHYCAKHKTGNADGIATVDGEIKTMEHYNKLKESISDECFGGVAAKYITITSLSLLSK